MIQIFILTHNRPDSLIETLRSVLNQKMVQGEYQIIISDNSTNDETEKRVNELLILHPKLSYRRRSPMASIEHFNVVLSEVTADFFMMFHDDDIMLSDMVATLQKLMSEDESLLAVGSNARLVKNGKIAGNFFKSQSDITIKSVDEIVTAYLDANHAPFPSYMYRKHVAENIKLDTSKGGKYCDVSFLLDTASHGHVRMVKEPLMNYYLHEGQDSASHVSEQQSRLHRYMIKVSSFEKDSPELMKHRLLNLYFKLTHLNEPIANNRWKRIKNIFFKHSPFYLFPRLIVKRMLKRV